MATVTRTNGLGHEHEVLYSTANLKAYVLDAPNLAAEGGIGKSLEFIGQSLQPLMMNSEGTGGLVNLIMDGSQTTAASLQERVRAWGSSVGSNGIDFSSATVTEGGQILVSA